MSTLATAFHRTVQTASDEPSRSGSLFAALLREIRIRRALREASSLDDTTLLDIGLSRGGIEDAIRHGRR